MAFNTVSESRIWCIMKEKNKWLKTMGYCRVPYQDKRFIQRNRKSESESMFWKVHNQIDTTLCFGISNYVKTETFQLCLYEYFLKELQPYYHLKCPKSYCFNILAIVTNCMPSTFSFCNKVHTIFRALLLQVRNNTSLNAGLVVPL